MGFGKVGEKDLVVWSYMVVDGEIVFVGVWVGDIGMFGWMNGGVVDMVILGGCVFMVGCGGEREDGVYVWFEG